MQPRNPFQGQPASNMSFPTEAYMAAAANAAKIQADAQAQMGQAIGAGLQKAGAAVGDYMSQKADYEASSKIFDSPSFRQAMGLSEDDAKQQKTILKELAGEGGYKAANAYAKQQIDSLITYHAFKMQKELQSSRIAQQGDVDLNKIGAAAMLDAYGKTPAVPLGSTPGTSATRSFTAPIKLDLTTGQTGF
jgi:hypothetical protein